MKTSSFIADSTAEALAQVRDQLGPQAVVMKMWHLPAAGLGKLWQKRRVGVLAGVVESAANQQDLREDLLAKISELNRQLPPLSEQDRDTLESLLAAVPEQAVTLTIPRLLRAERLFCVVPGAHKRIAVASALRGPIATDCPASVLRRHGDCTLYLDAESDPDA